MKSHLYQRVAEVTVGRFCGGMQLHDREDVHSEVVIALWQKRTEGVLNGERTLPLAYKIAQRTALNARRNMNRRQGQGFSEHGVQDVTETICAPTLDRARRVIYGEDIQD